MYSGFGAGALSTQLEIYRWEDHFSRLRAARADNSREVEIAALRALVQRLVDYARSVEQQHNSLLAEAKKLDAQRLQQIDGLTDENARLRETVARLTAALAAQAKLNEENYNSLLNRCNFIKRGYNALVEKYGPPSQS
jgi:Mg2+ and Co2+ transporter CorA